MVKNSLQPELEKLVANKWILCDTNVLINASKYPAVFGPIFALFEDAEADLVYSQLVRAEFLQSVWQPELIEEREKFLEDLGIEDLPLRPIETLTDMVMSITRRLRARQKPLPDLVDSYLIALVKRYGQSLFLLTSNHKDFAYSLKRMEVWPIELNEESVITVGLYGA